MYTKHLHTMALPMTYVLVMGMVPLQAQTESEEVTSPEALLSYSGGAAIGKRAKTQTTGTIFTAINQWVTLPNSTISWTVPAFGSDLLNVSFSAECAKNGGGLAFIRILDTTNGVVLQPYEPLDFQPFCSTPARATHKGNWIRRPPTLTFGQTHNLVVQFRQTVGSIVIDNWTFELVAYN